MLSVQNVEEIAGFVQRYCAVGGNDGSEAPTEGYFAFCAGRTARGARAARANIPVRGAMSVEATVAHVVARVRDVVTSGEGNCYLRYFEHGAAHATEQLVIAGESSADEEVAIVDDGSVIGSLTAALLVRARMDARRIDDLERRVDQRQLEAMEERQQLVLLSVATNLLEASNKQQQAAMALQALAPVAQAAMPAVLDWLSRGRGPRQEGGAQEGGGEAQAAAATPEEEIDRLVQLLVASAHRLGEVAAAHPTAVGGRLAPLLPVLQAVATWFGLELRQQSRRRPKG